MKRCMALLLCVWLLMMGALGVSADSTTATVGGDVTETEIITQTTIYYEEVQVEVVEKVRSPYPQGNALACILLGGSFLLLAIALLCVFLFAFPRWGLVESAVTEDAPAVQDSAPEEGAQVPTEGETATPTEESTVAPAQESEATPSDYVSLEDLF